MADIDGDGDLDVVGTNEVWSNNGSGIFSDSAQALGGGTSVAVGDLDGDGDLDAFVGNTDLFDHNPSDTWIARPTSTATGM